VVEGAALEMLFRGNFNEGSNPSLSVENIKNINNYKKGLTEQSTLFFLE
jgi:hypothetical protein